MELRQGTQYWDEVVKKSTHTFTFVDEQPTFNDTLKMTKDKIFAEIHIEVANSHGLWYPKP